MFSLVIVSSTPTPTSSDPVSVDTHLERQLCSVLHKPCTWHGFMHTASDLRAEGTSSDAVWKASV